MQWDDYINPLDFMPASAFDYADWLLPWIQRGGTPTHFYDYPCRVGTFIIALRDIDVIPRYGAQSVHILVPPGIKAHGRVLGHSALYFLGKKPTQVMGGSRVNVYNDPVFMQVDELRAEMRAHQEHRRQQRFRHELRSRKGRALQHAAA